MHRKRKEKGRKSRRVRSWNLHCCCSKKVPLAPVIRSCFLHWNGQCRKNFYCAETAQTGTKTRENDYDFSGEQVHFESPPHRGDLATNIALGATLLWLPLTIAAMTRAAFVKYRFTDKRISVITEAPWKSMAFSLLSYLWTQHIASLSPILTPTSKFISFLETTALFEAQECRTPACGNVQRIWKHWLQGIQLLFHLKLSPRRISPMIQAKSVLSKDVIHIFLMGQAPLLQL